MIKKLVCGAIAVSLLLMNNGCNGGEPDTYNMGDRVETEFFAFTVGAAERDDTSRTERNAPNIPEGQQLLWVKVTVENHSSAPVPLYYDDFDLLIHKEPRFPERVFSAYQLAEDQMLEAGDTVTGELVYLIPKGEKRLKIAYDEYYDNNTQGKRYTVKISV